MKTINYVRSELHFFEKIISVIKIQLQSDLLMSINNSQKVLIFSHCPFYCIKSDCKYKKESACPHCEEYSRVPTISISSYNIVKLPSNGRRGNTY